MILIKLDDIDDPLVIFHRRNQVRSATRHRSMFRHLIGASIWPTGRPRYDSSVRLANCSTRIGLVDRWNQSLVENATKRHRRASLQLGTHLSDFSRWKQMKRSFRHLGRTESLLCDQLLSVNRQKKHPQRWFRLIVASNNLSFMRFSISLQLPTMYSIEWR